MNTVECICRTLNSQLDVRTYELSLAELSLAELFLAELFYQIFASLVCDCPRHLAESAVLGRMISVAVLVVLLQLSAVVAFSRGGITCLSQKFRSDELRAKITPNKSMKPLH